MKHRGSHSWVACCVLPGEKEILSLTKQGIFRPNLRQSSNPDSFKNGISTSDKTKPTTGENESSTRIPEAPITIFAETVRLVVKNPEKDHAEKNKT